MENLNKDSSVKEYKNVYDKRVNEDLEEIEHIIMMAKKQREILLEMRDGKPEPEISVTQKILDAIDGYFADKTVGYIKDDESNETQTILKVFDPQTNSTAIIRITSMDWL